MCVGAGCTSLNQLFLMLSCYFPYCVAECSLLLRLSSFTSLTIELLTNLTQSNNSVFLLFISSSVFFSLFLLKSIIILNFDVTFLYCSNNLTGLKKRWQQTPKQWAQMNVIVNWGNFLMIWCYNVVFILFLSKSPDDYSFMISHFHWGKYPHCFSL